MLKRAILAPILAMSVATIASAQRDDTVVHGSRYWSALAAGAATSILIHEAAHVGTAIASGARPTFGFDTGRPTVFSGIDSHRYPRRQFWFSSAGLDIQSLLDEAILDVPHHRGSAFERGLLAGGIGTTLFYLTVGRWGSVSDVDFMARTHVMNKTEITLIYGSVAASHIWRIRGDPAYAHFFVAPSSNGLNAGLRF